MTHHNPEYQKFIPEAEGLKVGSSHLTPSDILGPFYRPGALFRTNIVPDHQEVDPNTKLTLTGKVLDESGAPVAVNTYIEFWQANPDGQYDEAGPNLRGIQPVGEDGSYHLETIRPGFYDISDPNDPEPHDFRCAHIHAKIWVNGRDVLTTQLYFKDDKYNETDHWFDKRRVIEFTDKNGKFDFVIKKP